MAPHGVRFGDWSNMGAGENSPDINDIKTTFSTTVQSIAEDIVRGISTPYGVNNDGQNNSKVLRHEPVVSDDSNWWGLLLPAIALLLVLFVWILYRRQRSNSGERVVCNNIVPLDEEERLSLSIVDAYDLAPLPPPPPLPEILQAPLNPFRSPETQRNDLMEEIRRVYAERHK